MFSGRHNPNATRAPYNLCKTLTKFLWRSELFSKLGCLERFEATLSGDLDRAIHRVDSQIRRSETFMLWFMVPAFITVLISFSQKYSTKSLDDWLLVGLSFPLAYLVVRAGWRCGLMPAKRELEALKQKYGSVVTPAQLEEAAS